MIKMGDISMSMNRQIFLMIISISLLALVGSVVASTYSTRAYLIEQLGIKNQDNASALALSLTQSVKLSLIHISEPTRPY